MDVLAEVIGLLRIRGQLYGRLELTAPWGFEFPGDKGICLMVTRGSCFLGVDQQPLIPLVGGDFVLLPEPETYSLRSSPEIRVRSVLEVSSPEAFQQSRLITYTGGGTSTSVIAGCFHFATPESAWLVKYLPPIIHISASDTHAAPWFQSTLQFFAGEVPAESSTRPRTNRRFRVADTEGSEGSEESRDAAARNQVMNSQLVELVQRLIVVVMV